MSEEKSQSIPPLAAPAVLFKQCSTQNYAQPNLSRTVMNKVNVVSWSSGF